MSAVDAADVALQFADAFKQKSIVEDYGKKYVVDQVEFGVMSGTDITKYSLMEVHNRELYDPSNRDPFIFGCLDRRLGVANKSSGACKTCGQSVTDCTGHFGFVRLCLPVFHVGYFKHTIALLTCVCKECSHLLFEDEERERYLKRMRSIRHDPLARKLLFRKMVVEARTLTSCPKCEAVNGPVRKFVGQPLKLYHEVNPKKLANAMGVEDASDQYRLFLNRPDEPGSEVVFRGKLQEELSPLRVKKILEKIPEEDWEVLDVVNPESLLITHAIVPPICIRPSVMMGDAGSNEDDITIRVSEIVNCNALLRGLIVKGAPIRQLWDNWDFLALQCALLVNGDLPGLPQGVLSKPTKGICQRLKGKEGRFRGNLSGKRVDFSGRTVISPDPNLRIDEVAVPQWMAKRLTFPETVCEANLPRLKRAVLQGADEYPGAQFITRVDGQKSMLRYGNRRQLAADLKIGDVVERHLIDGDVVLFNRQPSLHRMSIMAHRARVLPWRTLRFNECCCQPYNADFDGDEMNIHVPQTLEARAEALQLMGVVQNLITPKNGEPLVACTQDFLTGSYLLNQKGTFLNRSEASLVAAYFSDGLIKIRLPPPCIMKPVELWSGKQLFSLLMRPNETSATCINIEVKEREFSGCKPEFMCPVDGFVLIRNSELIAGAPGKATLGGAKNGLIFHLIRDNGAHTAALMMSRIAKCTSRWLMHRGMTIGMDDVTPNPKLAVEKTNLLNEGYQLVDQYINDYKDGKLKSRPGCTPEQTLEAQVKGALDELRDTAGKACKKLLKRSNKPLMMFLCGSKGQLINTAQMVACVGQQNVGGQRIKNGFVARTLPHFLPGSRDAAAKGFVGNSFYNGLTPYEFFFHTMSGREGLVDTAVKTADTGYMQRRLMKALEDLSTGYDRSVRTSGGQVVQFVYGDDGLNPHMMEGKNKPLEFPHVWLQIASLVRAERKSSLSDANARDRRGKLSREEEIIQNAVETFKALPVSANGKFTPILTSLKDLIGADKYSALVASAAEPIESIAEENKPKAGRGRKKAAPTPVAPPPSTHPTITRPPILPLTSLPKDSGVRLNRLRQLVGRIAFEGKDLSQMLKGCNAEECVALTDVRNSLPELALTRIRSLASSNQLSAFRDACQKVDRSAFAKNSSWESLASQIEAEILVALVPESQRDTPLLPCEIRSWMAVLANRVSESVPVSLKDHMNLSAAEDPTHQALTASMITFQSDLEGFLESHIVSHVNTALTELGVSDSVLSQHHANTEGEINRQFVQLGALLSQLKSNSPTTFKREDDNADNTTAVGEGSSTAATDETMEALEGILSDDSEDGVSASTSVKRRKSPTGPVAVSIPSWNDIARSLICRGVNVCPRSIMEFYKLAWKKYIKALVQPGEAVGAVGGQSIGEPGTQMTLKTFHFAGVASMNVTLGVPRIKEIINGAKNITTPIMHVILESPQSVYAARLVKSRIERTSLGDICASIKEVFTPTGENRMHISVKLDVETIQGLGHLDLTVEEIVQKVAAHPPLAKLKLKPEHIVVRNDFKFLVCPPSADRNNALFVMRAVKALLPSVCIRGVTTAKRGVVNLHDEKVEKGEKPWYDVFVEGYGLREVMAVEGVVGTKSTTNHIDEVNKVLGIEAARVTIIKEIKGCMDAYSMDIDIRHMMLMGDVMTCRGEVLGINRFGISKMRGSTLLLASFEETNEHLFEAAAHRRKDPVEGVSECIIMGKPVKLGTGSFNLLQDLTSSSNKETTAAVASPLSSQKLFGFPSRQKNATLIAKYRTLQQSTSNDVDMA